jgi:hypothetical protein
LTKILYSDGYKNRLEATYQIVVAIRPPLDIYTEYIDLSREGLLTIRRGFLWDGPSGPTADKWFPRLYNKMQRGALIHDALYWLIRHGFLDPGQKQLSDGEFRKACLQDGMIRARAWWIYWGVRMGGKSSIDPKNKRQIKVVP